MADNLNDCAPAVRTVSNGGCPAIRVKGGGGKHGVISQTQTWTQAADGGYDYTMSDIEEGTIPQANIDLFEAAGAVFNEDTGYFELNGLVDISYQEMIQIYNNRIGETTTYRWAGYVPMRTNLLMNSTMAQTAHSAIGLLYQNAEIEALNMYTYNPGTGFVLADINGITNFAYRSSKLRKVVGLNISRITSAQTNVFFVDTSLETLEMSGLKISIDLGHSSRLSAASVLYIVQNEASTSAITITLHATAYARAIADADVQTALAAHPNVSLASA